MQRDNLKGINVHVFITISFGNILALLLCLGESEDVYVCVCFICLMINCLADLTTTYLLYTTIYTIWSLVAGTCIFNKTAF